MQYDVPGALLKKVVRDDDEVGGWARWAHAHMSRVGMHGMQAREALLKAQVP